MVPIHDTSYYNSVVYQSKDKQKVDHDNYEQIFTVLMNINKVSISNINILERLPFFCS